MKKHIICLLLWVSVFSVSAQNDTTNDTWRIEGDRTLTDSTTIITNRLGIGTANFEVENGLHLYDKYIYLQRNNSPMWRISTSYGSGTFWIQNVTNNVNAFRMEANGYIGIGTGASITPAARLHVKSYNHWALLVEGGINQGTKPILFVRRDNDEPLFSVHDNRMVNIGTGTPTASLQISPSDSLSFQDFSALKVSGAFDATAAQIINTYESNQAGGLLIETADGTGTADALRVVTNRSISPKTMLRIPNYSENISHVLLAEDGGNVGIGTANPQKALDVCGHIRAKEVVIESGWCDFVFEKDYPLPTLQEQRTFIAQNGHLKNFDSAEEMLGEIQVADITTKQQQTIEEMMLYLLQMEEEMNAFQAENTALQARVEALEKELNQQNNTKKE